MTPDQIPTAVVFFVIGALIGLALFLLLFANRR